LAGSAAENVTKLSLASKRMQAAERAHGSQLCRLLSSDHFNRQRGVAMSITVTISAVQSPTPDVTQMRCRTVAVHCRWDRSLWTMLTKPHRLLLSFSLTGTIFLSIHSHFARIQSSRSQYFTSTVLTTYYVVLISTFTESSLQKPPC